MSEECRFYMDKLRNYMFENVYHSRIVKKDEELDKIKNMIYSLYDYYQNNVNALPQERSDMIEEFGVDEVVKDHIAGMTDRYALNLFHELFVPKGWR